MTGDRQLLLELYRAAVAAADPLLVTTRLLNQLQPPAPHQRVWLFGIGKAAPGMTAALAEWVQRFGERPLRGIVVSTSIPDARLPGIEYLEGDHPMPGERSFAAAERLGEVAAEVVRGDLVYVLISGGTSSLIGAPVAGISLDSYCETFARLLASGIAIDEMNAQRKPISRWADGRLAMALSHALVQPLIISDVVSDDPVTIGSGPCSPRGATLDHVAAPVLASYRLPVTAVFAAAAKHGLSALAGPLLVGEAREAGRAFANEVVRLAAASTRPTLLISGGETTVTLGDSEGLGGRCQEFALAAAEVLASLHSSVGSVAVLAAGTDGRDGPTDAAGAIVGPDTWSLIKQSGRDPHADLAAHDSYQALDAAKSLVRTGPTGTNMLDVAIGMVGGRPDARV